MNETVFDKKKVIVYLIATFGIAWAIQAVVFVLYITGNKTIGKLVMTVMMFAPLAGTLIANKGLKEIGFKPSIKRNIKTYLFAWFIPAAFTVVGAALYFALFPAHFDLSGSYIVETAGKEALAQMEAGGISYPVYILITVIACLTYAPAMNLFIAFGEEVGWRGFLYPQLKAGFGKRNGLILGGIIWGVWHWPLIWLIGYEYGTDYIGFPTVGMIVFLVFTISLGIISDWLYERSKSIWAPSIFHGSINAAATIPAAICLTSTGSLALLGPVPNGLLAGLPIAAFAAILFVKHYKSETE